MITLIVTIRQMPPNKQRGAGSSAQANAAQEARTNEGEVGH